MTCFMARLARWTSIVSIAALAGASMLISAASRSEETKPDASLIAKGEYLARAGDCVACHTAPEGKLFAGGLTMPTPFGTLYTSNITPDRETGIGTWTADQFYATMHVGRFPDGGLLYPAMPFGSYTKVTRADSDAIFAYLQTLPRPCGSPTVRTICNSRSTIARLSSAGALSFSKKASTSRTRASRRNGIEAPISSMGWGIAGMCHTAINAFGGSSESEAFQGGLIPMQNWYAPSLTSDKEAELGDWSLKDIADLLKTGVSARGAVYGPMSEVIYNSLQYLTDADIQAMAVYLEESGAGQPAGARDIERPERRRQPPARARRDHLRRQ